MIKEELESELEDILDEIEPWLIATRRHLHRHPELGYNEHKTSQFIEELFGSLDIHVKSGLAKTGLVGTLNGKSEKPVIGLRAELDALPIEDKKEIEYKSKVKNVMHACGHDAHMTILLGTAIVLNKLRTNINGTVKFIFQPAEEGPGGAMKMIEEGATEGIDYVFAQHVDPQLPIGTIGFQEREAMASIDKFNIKIVGKGGHAAFPHKVVNPLEVSAHVILALQSIVSRTVDPLESAVLTVGKFHGGTKKTVIPEVVEIAGSVRTYKQNIRKQIESSIKKVLHHTTNCYGARYELEYVYGYDALINHEEALNILRETTKTIDIEIKKMPPVMSSEDFGAFLKKIPGCFWWLGAEKEEKENAKNLHSPYFDINENAIKHGVRIMSKLILNGSFKSKKR
ncbi:metal-dependent amidase/aminoacylase/carboxypeptidase [Gracilibacillus halophilus YIM-C55.5]|uniref:Metal-dependent amidase/aminoacylase/carboxypeptidase n=1 Tax=Gracilibacillus halophilus YIM-C55.5 TaxID=1308866 RepID=N4W609_9BACI|nr:M20 family metallopeptidase [Gracilibacillus halophilus]ENH95638.1 metal-dependent amidase/aminoacylase/carboxypeptidase [Gracilibacillus halophilus YIM-C55.5]